MRWSGILVAGLMLSMAACASDPATPEPSSNTERTIAMPALRAAALTTADLGPSWTIETTEVTSPTEALPSLCYDDRLLTPPAAPSILRIALSSPPGDIRTLVHQSFLVYPTSADAEAAMAAMGAQARACPATVDVASQPAGQGRFVLAHSVTSSGADAAVGGWHGFVIAHTYAVTGSTTGDVNRTAIMANANAIALFHVTASTRREGVVLPPPDWRGVARPFFDRVASG